METEATGLMRSFRSASRPSAAPAQKPGSYGSDAACAEVANKKSSSAPQSDRERRGESLATEFMAEASLRGKCANCTFPSKQSARRPAPRLRLPIPTEKYLPHGQVATGVKSGQCHEGDAIPAFLLRGMKGMICHTQRLLQKSRASDSAPKPDATVRSSETDGETRPGLQRPWTGGRQPSSGHPLRWNAPVRRACRLATCLCGERGRLRMSFLVAFPAPSKTANLRARVSTAAGAGSAES